MITSIKQVEFHSKADNKSHFEMLKLESILTLKPTDHNQFNNHRLTFFALLIITKGEGKHTINFTDYTFQKGTVLAIGASSIHRFHKSEAQGYLLVFKEDFVLQYLSEENATKIFRLFNDQLVSPKQQLNAKDFKFISKHMNSIKKEFVKIKDAYSQELIRSLLHIIVTHLIRLKSANNASLNKSKYLQQFLKFQDLVEKNVEDQKGVSDYADQMCITTRTLNNITRSVVNKSAKMVIDEILTIRIKRYLINSKLSIAQIAYQTGFKEPSHLSKFLNKHTGLAPKEFRKLF